MGTDLTVVAAKRSDVSLPNPCPLAIFTEGSDPDLARVAGETVESMRNLNKWLTHLRNEVRAAHGDSAEVVLNESRKGRHQYVTVHIKQVTSTQSSGAQPARRDVNPEKSVEAVKAAVAHFNWHMERLTENVDRVFGNELKMTMWCSVLFYPEPTSIRIESKPIQIA